MPLNHYDLDLGELHQACSTRFLRKIAELGISPWYDKRTSRADSRGVALFARYDGQHACLRMLPNAPRYFQTSLLKGMISTDEANRMLRRLLEFCRNVVPKYDGYFSHELKMGRIANILRQAENLDDYDLYQAHHGLLPDELFANLPWPCLPEKHFRSSVFGASGLEPEVAEAVASQPLRALGIAVDFICMGPGTGLPCDAIMSIFDALEGGGDQFFAKGAYGEQRATVQRIVLPCLIDGFQGLTIGIFSSLPPKHQDQVLRQLLQFNETLGQKCAAIRRQEGMTMLEGASNPIEMARGILRLIPPSASVTVTDGEERAGFHMRLENDYWAGYEFTAVDELNSALDEEGDLTFSVSLHGRPVTISIRMLSGFDGLDPYLARLRMIEVLWPILSSLRIKDIAQYLLLSEVITAHQGLLEQINKERGAHAACKLLYLMDAVLRRYSAGEVVIGNEGCRKFMADRLKRVPTGYQVCGKAAEKYESDITKLLPNRFTFETLNATKISVRWQPKAVSVSEQLG